MPRWVLNQLCIIQLFRILGTTIKKLLVIDGVDFRHQLTACLAFATRRLLWRSMWLVTRLGTNGASFEHHQHDIGDEFAHFYERHESESKPQAEHSAEIWYVLYSLYRTERFLTRSSATAKSTVRPSCLVGVLYDIYRETNNRSTAN